jgi:hypothetical protein
MDSAHAHPHYQIFSLDEWARKGMISSQATLDQVHRDFGFPPFALGSWRRKFVRVCRDATLLVCEVQFDSFNHTTRSGSNNVGVMQLAITAAVIAQFLTLLPQVPATTMQKVTMLLIHCSLMLNLAGTILAFFVSQFGYFLDDEIHSPTDNNKETIEERLFRCQPFIYRIAIWLLSFLVCACMINTSLGAIFFFCGFLMYVWTEEAKDIARALISVVGLLAAPILLHMAVCIIILIGVFVAWMKIRWAGVTINDEQADSGDKETMEAGVIT